MESVIKMFDNNEYALGQAWIAGGGAAKLTRSLLEAGAYDLLLDNLDYVVEECDDPEIEAKAIAIARSQIQTASVEVFGIDGKLTILDAEKCTPAKHNGLVEAGANFNLVYIKARNTRGVSKAEGAEAAEGAEGKAVAFTAKSKDAKLEALMEQIAGLSPENRRKVEKLVATLVKAEETVINAIA